MKIEEINIEGKNVGSLSVSDKIFSLKPRKRYNPICSRLAKKQNV